MFTKSEIGQINFFRPVNYVLLVFSQAKNSCFSTLAPFILYRLDVTDTLWSPDNQYFIYPTYCIREDTTNLSCRERESQQLLHFENEIQVVTKFKIFMTFHKNIVRGSQTLKHRPPTNILFLLWLFDRNVVQFHFDKDILKCIFIVQFILGWKQEYALYWVPQLPPNHLVSVVHHYTICCFAHPGSPKKVVLGHKWRPRGYISLLVTLLYIHAY